MCHLRFAQFDPNFYALSFALLPELKHTGKTNF